MRPSFFQISVSDTGLGIRKEDQDKLLVDFGRLTHSEDQSLNHYGIGLGLSISDTLSKELSGEGKGLHLESERGKGSTFSFFVKDFNETDCRFGEVSSLPSIPNFALFRNLEENVVQSVTQSVITTRTHTTIKKPRTSLDVLNSNMFLAENDIILKNSMSRTHAQKHSTGAIKALSLRGIGRDLKNLRALRKYFSAKLLSFWCTWPSNHQNCW